MGLDGVELVVRFEEVFGITIEDKEAEKLTTPREIIDLVMTKVENSSEQVCLNQRAFHLLRRAFAATTRTSRQRFRLETKLERLIPSKCRRGIWSQLASQVGANNWPELTRPRWLEAIIWSSSFILGLSLWSAATNAANWRNAFSQGYAVLLVCGTWFLFVSGGYLVTRPFRIAVPLAYSQVKDLVRFLVATSPNLLKAEPKKWSRDQVAALVREIVIEQLGITNYREDGRFVQDFGMG